MTDQHMNGMQMPSGGGSHEGSKPVMGRRIWIGFIYIFFERGEVTTENSEAKKNCPAFFSRAVFLRLHKKKRVYLFNRVFHLDHDITNGLRVFGSGA